MRVLRFAPWLLLATLSAMVVAAPCALAQDPQPPAPDPAEPQDAQAAQPAPGEAAAGAAPTTHDATVPRAREGFVPKRKKSERTGREIVVINNAELDRMFGTATDDEAILAELTGELPADAQEPAATARKPARSRSAASATRRPASIPAPLPPLPAPQASPQQQAAPAAENGAERAAAIRAELQRLDQKARHLHNPFLPPAPQTEAERAAERDLDAVQRLQRIDQEKQRLQQELEKVQKPAG